MTQGGTSGREPLPLRRLVLLWLGWAVILLGFQALAPGRFEIQRPDFATPWTPGETRADSHADQPYLRDPLLNAHAAWDSEFYISIALHGYDDPGFRALAPGSELGATTVGAKGEHPGWTSLNYAFFPAYPWAMRVLAWPLRALGLSPVGAVVTAGVVISLAGTLAAMVAICDLAQAGQADAGEGTRAAVYLLVWPASFFLAQVYTEGLFLGLSFGALALARRRRWLAAGGLAAVATWTRSTGAFLLLPLVWMWLESGGLARLRARPLSRELVAAGAVAAPALAYVAWRLVFGAPFDVVESRFFGRGLLWLDLSLSSWREALDLVRSRDLQARSYYAVEVWGVAWALVASLLLLWRGERALALYGLAILGVALTSGSAQGMRRYVLSLPALFLVPAWLGRSAVFDRLWTLGNTMAMAVFALAFSYDFWAG